ncbi:MAG: glycerophosphodiester phosphodiesterase family protein [Silicimonas sp.]
MIPALPESLIRTPIAHRGLHDVRAGRPENSRVAVRAAIEAGYGIEIDIQRSADGQAMVFHDYRLERLTEGNGRVDAHTAEELAGLTLRGGDEGVPTLGEILDIVGGRVALLVEIKDQDGALGDAVGPLERAVATALKGYDGDVAVMSFNPWAVASMRDLAPDIARGLTTEDFAAVDDWAVTLEERRRLSELPDYDRVGAVFISHNHRHLLSPRVAELKAAGAKVLSWTIRSPEEEAEARRIADNVTFEGYLP